MVACSSSRFEVLLYLLCFQGFWVETHVRMIKAAYVGLIMRTQGCSSVRMNQPRNPNFCFLLFYFHFHMYTST